ncbi:colicin release lysis protein, partial [Escherichia coli]|uniref:colicin release lysis protein n=1 Tax=Escherichia coli TaxID=562 RepID=UPI0039A6D9EF
YLISVFYIHVAFFGWLEIMCGKILLILFFIMTLSACQVNHIRDVKGGTVAPSSSSRLTGVEIK